MRRWTCTWMRWLRMVLNGGAKRPPPWLSGAMIKVCLVLRSNCSALVASC